MSVIFRSWGSGTHIFQRPLLGGAVGLFDDQLPGSGKRRRSPRRRPPRRTSPTETMGGRLAALRTTGAVEMRALVGLFSVFQYSSPPCPRLCPVGARGLSSLHIERRSSRPSGDEARRVHRPPIVMLQTVMRPSIDSEKQDAPRRPKTDHMAGVAARVPISPDDGENDVPWRSRQGGSCPVDAPPAMVLGLALDQRLSGEHMLDLGRADAMRQCVPKAPWGGGVGCRPQTIVMRGQG